MENAGRGFRERNDSAFAFFGGQRRDLVVRAAKLERAAALERLCLQMHGCVDERVERVRRDYRRPVRDTCEPLGCGAARRWFEEFEAEVPDTCPQCGGELLRRCKACGAGFSSIAVVDCEECGEPVRPNEMFGSKIRRG